MSWANELYAVYELASQNPALADEDPKNPLLPIYHLTLSAQIEVSIDEDGNFQNASIIPSKEAALTVVPVTEDSGARSSGIAPMPFADKLMYIAGDYAPYVDDEKKSKSQKCHKLYMEALREWAESEDDTHPAVIALAKYLEKDCVISDLIACGILKVDETTGMFAKISNNNVKQEDSMLRFAVQYKDLTKERRTWLDRDLYQQWIKRCNALDANPKSLCYATGEEAPISYKHPPKIRNGGDKARLFSANDESGFSYRGRFDSKDETVAIGREFSQKMHNALRWLIARQGHTYGPLTIVTWASALKNVPDILDSAEIEDNWEDDEAYDTLPKYKAWLSKYIFGLTEQLKTNDKVMIMGLDSPLEGMGTISVSLYDELDKSEFLSNLETWHSNLAWLRYDGKRKKTVCKSFTLYDIIKSAYGTERKKGKNTFVECDDKLLRSQILRLIPCVTEGRPIPLDLLSALRNKASNPQAYEEKYNHNKIIEVTCGLLRATRKGELNMYYDPNLQDRSYLYGCLLAIADKAESDTYEASEKKRVTNARRFWSSFSQTPYRTWQVIEEHLRPYLDKNPYRAQYEKWIQEVMDKFDVSAFTSNKPLDTMYLLGYHQFMSYMYNNKKEENK